MMLFAFQDKVVVSAGFYRGKKGTIIKVDEKKNPIQYLVKLDGIGSQWIGEDNLKKPSFTENLADNFSL